MARRILVVGVDWIGDVIFSTPLIRALRNTFSDAYIAYSTSSSAAEVLEGNPCIDRLIRFDEKPFFWGIRSNWTFFKEVRDGKFDTAVFLHRSSTRAFLTKIAGIKKRVGATTQKGSVWLTDPVMSWRSLHRIDRYLECAKSLNLNISGREVEVAFNGDSDNELKDLVGDTILNDGRDYVVVHPGGNWDLKRWPIKHFVEVVKGLADRGITTVICGTKRERALSYEITRKAGEDKTVSFSGRTSIKSLAHLIKRSKFMISGDSGPLHLACGLGVPVIALFGPTSVDITGPVSRSQVHVIKAKHECKVPCYAKKCADHGCMERILPSQVLQTIESCNLARR